MIGKEKYKEYDYFINTNTKDEFRILSIFDGNIITCKMNTTSLDVFYFSEDDLSSGISSGVYKVFTEEHKVIDPDIYFTNPNVDVRKMQIERFTKYKMICSAVYDEYKYKLYELAQPRKSKPTVKKLLF